jgi:hypothetical protein
MGRFEPGRVSTSCVWIRVLRELYLLHVPDTGLGVDVVVEIREDLLLGLGDAHKRAAHEVEAGRLVIFGDRVEQSTYRHENTSTE